MSRDDFSPAVKRALAERAGYRCSNPTCCVLTVKASPVSALGSTRIGMAAHITAASQDGPRYDASLSPEERKSIENGIWACQRCGRVIDSDKDAFSVEMLKNWKRSAERQAARDFNASRDSVADLIKLIDEAHETISSFIVKWRNGEPYLDNPFGADFNTRTSALMRYSQARLSAYQQQIAPLVLDITTKCEVFFGPEDELVQKSSLVLMAAPTNYFTLNDLDDYLQKLKTHLTLY